MKKVISSLMIIMVLAGFVYAGGGPCTPTGLSEPGVMPPPDSIPCIERGVFYEQIMQTMNYDTLFSGSILGFPVVAEVNYTQIDSIVNLPCGMSWESDTTTYGPGQPGCIRVYGTTNDQVGQFPLKIYMTMSVNISGLGSQSQSGELNDLIQQLQDLANQLGQTLPFQFPDVEYYSRVIIQGNNCPPIDRSAGAENLTSAGDSCPPFILAITGDTEFCTGGSTTLTAETQYTTGAVSYNWSTGSQDSTAAVTVAGTVSVTVTDNNGTIVKSVVTTAKSAPTPGFTVNASATPMVTITSQASGATSTSYDYGDGTSSTSSTTHTYTANGSFAIKQTVTNECGVDSTTRTVNITGVGIASVNIDNVSLNIIPNPNNGIFEISLSAKDVKEDYLLNIVNLEGKVVFDKHILSSSKMVREKLDLSDLPKGIYTVRLSAGNYNYIRKLVIY